MKTMNKHSVTQAYFFFDGKRETVYNKRHPCKNSSDRETKTQESFVLINLKYVSFYFYIYFIFINCRAYQKNPVMATNTRNFQFMCKLASSTTQPTHTY